MNASIDAFGLVDTAPNWTALHRSIRENAAEWTPPPGLARLRRWPDLADVPDEFVAPISRLCALLWNKPTASHLIGIVLGGNRNENLEILQMLHVSGYVELLSVRRDSASPPAPLEAAPSPASEPGRSSGLTSFIGKLRQRLLG